MKKFIIQNRRFMAKKIGRALQFGFFVAFFCFTLQEKTLAKADFLTTYKSELGAVEAYLNSISNFAAKFTQKSSNGIVEGKFFLSRPGKMRVEYINEPKILIVVNGSILSYKDIELDEVSNLSTNTTPASFLTRPNISFAAKDVEITNVVKTSESITISLIKKNRTEAGEFTLTFRTQPALGFAKMQVTNDLGEVTSITLHDVTFPANLNEDLFIIRNKNLPF